MSPDNGNADIRRLQLMATTEPPARGRRRQAGPAAISTIATIVAALAALIILAGIIGVYALLKDETPTPLAPAVTPTPFSLFTTPATTPAPSPTPTEDLVARARQIKPLEDISKGDRVLYQGHVCTWQSWDKNINTSTIRCPDAVAFEIQTGRLTPVELKSGSTRTTKD